MKHVTQAARLAARIIHGLSRTLAIVSMVGMAFIMSLIAYNIALRELGVPGVRGVVEYAELAMAVTAFFALGEAERRRQHVSVTALVDKLRGRAYFLVRMSAGIAAALVAVLLAWASWEVLTESLARGEYKLGLVRLPMWPARLAVFAGFMILAMEQIVTAIEDVTGRRRDEFAVSEAVNET